jgi:hypothetical protein
MPLPDSALLGKQHFGTALTYTESRNVTTGGDGLWSYAVVGQPALKYSDLDCDEDNGDGAYYLARPFVLAMWRLMNNLDIDGSPIWGSADAALANTADLLVYAMYNFTADSTMTWDKLCLALPGCTSGWNRASKRSRSTATTPLLRRAQRLHRARTAPRLP